MDCSICKQTYYYRVSLIDRGSLLIDPVFPLDEQNLAPGHQAAFFQLYDKQKSSADGHKRKKLPISIVTQCCMIAHIVRLTSIMDMADTT